MKYLIQVAIVNANTGAGQPAPIFLLLAPTVMRPINDPNRGSFEYDTIENPQTVPEAHAAMNISKSQWECTVKTKKEKHRIFIHAASVGVPIGAVTEKGLKPYRNNEDLTICFLSGYGLMCLPTQCPHLNISIESLMLMLENYSK